jgi:hypothetical protein
MLKKVLISILLLCFTLPLYSQDKDKEKKDKSKFDEYFIEKDYFSKGRPSIDLGYGLTETKLKNSGLSFVRNGIIELKLGYKYEQKSKYGNIVKFRNSYLHGSLISPGIDLRDRDNKVETWRFGVGSSTGLGYRLGRYSNLVFYNAGTFTWTRYNDGISWVMPFGYSSLNDYPPYVEYMSKMGAFDEHFRFGTGTEAGIIIPIGGLISFQAQYDRTIVFPRHLVWKNLGSMLLEAMAQGAIDGFVRAIMKSTPEAGPIVSFLLKNGLSYGLYELRREKMNWPFNSEKPLLFDSFKLGVTLTF